MKAQAEFIIPETAKVPRDAYRYWPTKEQIYYGTGKKMQRLIFDRVELTEFEDDKLKRLEAEIAKEHIQLPQGWTRNHVLRFCYGTNWKTRIALKILKNHLDWRQEVMPHGYLSLYPQLTALLNSGCLYIHGRDHNYRPLLIMNFPKFDFKKYTHSDFVILLCFLLEFMVNTMLLPGQVETWVALSDMGHQGMNSLPISHLKKIVQDLQENFRCRLGVNYVINAPSGLYFLWRCVKPFVDEITCKKIKIMKESMPRELYNHCNPNQVERKYGGTAPDLTQYWPPVVPPGPYEPPSKNNSKNKDSYFEHHPDELVKEEPVVKLIEEKEEEEEEEEEVEEKEEESPPVKSNIKHKGKKVADIIIPEVEPEENSNKEVLFPHISNNIEPESEEIVTVKVKKSRKSKHKQEETPIEEEIQINLSEDLLNIQRKREKLNQIVLEDIESEPINTDRLLRTGRISIESNASSTGCTILGFSAPCASDSKCCLF